MSDDSGIVFLCFLEGAVCPTEPNDLKWWVRIQIVIEGIVKNVCKLYAFFLNYG